VLRPVPDTERTERTERTDAALLAESDRDPDAFAVLYDRYAGSLYRYAARRLGRDAAEDAVADTFLAAFARRQRYDPDRPDARPWLFGILTREIALRHRTEQARYRALRRAPIEHSTEGPAERVASGVTAQAARATLAAGLGQLADRDREVVLLLAWAELSQDEIARALDIPVGTVRSRLHRARRTLRAAFDGVDPTRDTEVS
jgi:RNA polymerase sigma-70 factor (ECF subfamily)